jgi:hypothetical protein
MVNNLFVNILGPNIDARQMGCRFLPLPWKTLLSRTRRTEAPQTEIQNRDGEGSEEQLQEERKNIMSKYSSLNLIVFPCMVLSEITCITSFEVLLCFLSLANIMTQDADFV